MTYKQQAEELKEKIKILEYDKDTSQADWDRYEAALNEMQAMKAKIEAELVSYNNQFLIAKLNKWTQVILTLNKSIEDCQEAIKKLDEVLS